MITNSQIRALGRLIHSGAFRICLLTTLVVGLTGPVGAQQITDFTGLTVAQAEERVAANGYSIEHELDDSPARRGTIIDQSPSEGGTPGTDGVIKVKVSDGLVIPANLVGKRPEAASALLREMGASAQVTERDLVNTKHGMITEVIVDVAPDGRFDASIGVVTLIVANEIGVLVPRLVGNVAQMRQELSKVGLKLDYSDKSGKWPGYSRNPCRHYVFRGGNSISPAVSSLVARGSTVKVERRGEYYEEFFAGPNCQEDVYR